MRSSSIGTVGFCRSSTSEGGAPATCLEEMLEVEVPEVALYITKERRRDVYRTEEHRSRVVSLVEEARLRLQEEIPPNFASRLCQSCSVRNACQPRGAEWR